MPRVKPIKLTMKLTVFPINLTFPCLFYNKSCKIEAYMLFSFRGGLYFLIFTLLQLSLLLPPFPISTQRLLPSFPQGTAIPLFVSMGHVCVCVCVCVCIHIYIYTRSVVNPFIFFLPVSLPPIQQLSVCLICLCFYFVH